LPCSLSFVLNFLYQESVENDDTEYLLPLFLNCKDMYIYVTVYYDFYVYEDLQLSSVSPAPDKEHIRHKHNRKLEWMASHWWNSISQTTINGL
jgi:hypothetical protein